MNNRCWPGVDGEARYGCGTGRLAVELRVRRHGRDLLATVGGGATHVGAVAMSAPAAEADGEAPVEILELPGHREGVLAGDLAAGLAAGTGLNCVVVAGIHIERATPLEIETLVANAQRCLSDYLVDFVARS